MRRRQRGQGLMEYSLILALVLIVVVVVIALTGRQMLNAFQNVVNAYRTT